MTQSTTTMTYSCWVRCLFLVRPNCCLCVCFTFGLSSCHLTYTQIVHLVKRLSSGNNYKAVKYELILVSFADIFTV